MNKKNTISSYDEEEIFSIPINEIRRDYLSKKDHPYSLYTKYYKKYNINKELFLSIINLLKTESNQPIKKPGKRIKVRRTTSPYKNDKRPSSYNN